MAVSSAWPELPYEAWRDTHATLHLWLQIVGKLRLAQTPWINHSWHVPLYVSARGLTTTAIPHGERTFQVDFDFVSHVLVVSTSDGAMAKLPLEPQPVAQFYTRLMALLASLDLPIRINTMPNEIADAIPFPDDQVHASYDADAVHRYWRILTQAHHVFTDFRARFIGKCSPVHSFWGGPDLAVTRFSGRAAPLHPGGVPNLPDRVAREAYSHEVSSAGFWAGGGPAPYPLFYSYAYPEPAGYADAEVRPAGATYNRDLREFVLPYDVVRQSPAPEAALLAFLESTYDAAASLGQWPRSALER
jgi:hypothetical protein